MSAPPLRAGRRLLAALLCVAAVSPARAAGNALLIQLQRDGHYQLWRSEGGTRFSDDELAALETSARPEGGAAVATAAGPAIAYAQDEGVLVVVPGAARDATVLIDEDGCNGTTQWHPADDAALDDGQLTDIVQAALPGGGRNVRVGTRYAKGFVTRLGVRVVLWEPGSR